MWYGMYKGICHNNVDPEGMGRIQATCPQIFGNNSTLTGWAWPCVSPGTLKPPRLLEGVWLAFEDGDVDHPIWMGVWKLGVA